MSTTLDTLREMIQQNVGEYKQIPGMTPMAIAIQLMDSSLTLFGNEVGLLGTSIVLAHAQSTLLEGTRKTFQEVFNQSKI